MGEYRKRDRTDQNRKTKKRGGILSAIILIVAVLDFSGIVLYEAVLSYVGVGVDPTTHSFGSMINAGRLELSRTPVVWWNLCAAFTFMLTLVLSANLFASAVREAFDPRLVLKIGRKK